MIDDQMIIPESAAELKTEELKKGEEVSIIPESAAELKTEEEPELKPFLISYQRYNDKLCEISEGLVKNCQKKALIDLKKIGKEIFDFKDFKDHGIDAIPVEYKGEYKKLFNRLHPDVELYEHKLQETARIFYFLNEIKKIFYVVAITQAHYETDKVRR
jgi:hypothetical protein